jgi:hypothetical protein
MCVFTVSVEVQSTSPQPAQPLPLPPQAHLDFILAAVFAVLLLVCLFVLLFIWRSKRRQNSEPGACYCFKYNLVDVANLYYYKIEEKQGDNLVKTGSEN